jgi:hypothetical protein
MVQAARRDLRNESSIEMNCGPTALNAAATKRHM